MANGEEIQRDIAGLLRKVVALLGENDCETAERVCQKILSKSPSHPDAIHLRALALHKLGQLESASTLIKQSIEISPNNSIYFSNLAVICGELGDLEGGVEAARNAVRLNPDNANNLATLGNLLMRAGFTREAEETLNRVLSKRPDHVDALKNLSHLFVSVSRLSDAEVLSEKAVRLAPGDAQALAQYGKTLTALQRPADALSALKQAYSIMPSSKKICVALADALVQNDDPAQAFSVLKKLDEQCPGDPDILSDIGHVLRDLDRPAEAADYFSKALKLCPNHTEAHVNLGLTLLAEDNFQQAWKHYEYRSQQEETITLWPRRNASEWTEADLKDSRITVWTEQGLGDEVLQVSLLQDLVAMANSITLLCSERLTSLFAQSFPNVHVVSRTADDVNEYIDSSEFMFPLLSAGKILRKETDMFPKTPGYLSPDRDLVSELRSRYENLSDHSSDPFVISISWESRHSTYGKRNTIPLDCWLPVLRVGEESKRKVVFLSAQYGASPEEVTALGGHSENPVHFDTTVDHGGDMKTVAAQLAASDLVISTSTTTAQLAAALGKPTWHLPATGLACGWYWLTDSETTPWYPSMRQFRRSTRYHEGEQVTAIAKALAEHLENLG